MLSITGGSTIFPPSRAFVRLSRTMFTIIILSTTIFTKASLVAVASRWATIGSLLSTTFVSSPILTINICIFTALETLGEEVFELLRHSMSANKDLSHFIEALSVDLLFSLTTISYRFHIRFHLCPQEWLIEVDTHLRVHFDQAKSETCWNQEDTLLSHILSILDILDMLVNCCVSSYAGVVHFCDQIALCEMFRCLCYPFIHLQLLRHESLTFFEAWQFILHLFIPVEDFKPVEFLY